jgi:hypothetical protein
VDTPNSSRVAELLPSVAGLTVAAVIAASTSTSPRFFVSWPELFGFALERVLLVSLACVIVSAGLISLISDTAKLDQQALARTSRAAVWLVPLALLIRTHSLWTAFAAAIFAVIVTPAFRFGEEILPNPEDSLLSSLLPDTRPLSPKHSPESSVAAALTAQIGALAIFGGYSFFGALLISVAFAVWTWRSSPSPVLPKLRFSAESRFQSQTLLIAIVALVFTISALVPHLRGGRFGGLFGTTIRHGRYRAYAIASTQQYVPKHVLADSENSASEGNTGIVLWPLRAEPRKLVAPMPIDENAMHSTGRSSGPLLIPFDGVYWFFKAPDLRPPKSSRQAQANPDTVDIRSTDRRPLSIEAHDYLGSLIDLRCCSRIQIAIRNADRYPDTVSLELVLINTSLPNQPSQSLGEMMVKSTRPWKIYEKREPVTETLNFPIPPSLSLHRFDEVKIVFRLDRARADAGAKIAIDHFVLVPRGL